MDSCTWTRYAAQQKLIFIITTRTLGTIKRTYREQYPKGTDGKRDSRESIPSARFDNKDDDDDDDNDGVLLWFDGISILYGLQTIYYGVRKYTYKV